MFSETHKEMLYLEGTHINIKKKKVSVLITNDIVYPCAHSAQVCTQCAKEVDLKLTSFDEHTRAPGAQFVYT